jgi:agmatinase
MKLKKPTSQYYELFTPSLIPSKGAINLIGFEFDGTACFRKGTKDGPDAIRAVSEGIESYSPYQNIDLEDHKDKLIDLGNLAVGETDDIDGNWKKATEHFFSIFTPSFLLKEKGKILTLGGEHSISYAPIKTYLDAFPDLILIHLDAHADLRDGYNGHHYSHASIIRRAIDHFGKGHELLQYGIRSGTKEEYKWMNDNKTIRTSLESFIDSIDKVTPTRPIYLTIDLDFFDPSYLPGTGTPEAGGETFHTFIKIIKRLSKLNFVGADIVELSPNIDTTGNSDIFATKVTREIVMALL